MDMMSILCKISRNRQWERRKHDKETKKISGADAGGGPFGRLCGSHRNDDIRAVFRIRGDRLGDSKCHDSECAEYTGDDGIYRKKLAYGAAVTVVSETTGSDGKIWYKIQFSSGSGTQGGYVRSDYIKFPVSYSYDANFESYLNSQGFPESYKTSLRTLHTEHPTWVFQAQKTGLTGAM